MKLFTKQKKLVILLILCMGLGFAYLSSGLDIKMNTKLVANSWDVYFDNIQVIDGSVSATTPTITNKTTVDYSVTFEKPGDYYEFTVDAVNDGTIDVMVESITMTQLENSYLRYIHYKITYDEEDEEIEIKQKDVLKAKRRVTYKVLVEYKRDIEESDLLDADVDLNLSFTINYIKSDVVDTVEYGVIYGFDYTGEEQTFVAPETGTYRLEVWGAQGGYGSSSTYRGGYGGYSTGYIELSKDDNLYINVGGQGINGTSKNTALKKGGYNGGGSSAGTTDKYVGSGGGATHIALDSGLLSTFSSKRDKILIVAGGGGGGGFESSSYYSTGGNGGGYQGTTAIKSSTSHVSGTGGTQTSGGTGLSTASFGQGANATSDSIGGGGGYYGGGSGKYTSGGGGGSGYIGNTTLTNKVMYCYSCNQSEEESIKTVSTTNASDYATAKYVKIGNGYAKITFINDSKINFGNGKKTSQSVDINNINFNYSKGEISFTTSLNNTNEYAELSFEVENNTDINYYISKLKKSNYDNSKISYSVTYSDGTEVQEKTVIHSRTTKMITIKIQLLDSSISLEEEKFSLRLVFDKTKSTESYLGDYWEFTYTGQEESITLPGNAVYKLEVWGAQGGSSNNGYSSPIGGYGSYSIGSIALNNDTTLYINVGGKAADVIKSISGTAGGYNGGGKGGNGMNTSYQGGGGGGGATHIALDSGLLEELSEHATDNRILIVAGGGGGSLAHAADRSYPGGHAGGMSGNAGGHYSTSSNVSGGTQTTGYAFGKGQNAVDGGTGLSWGEAGRGGGGGGYYGGYASQLKNNGTGSGGGGSGYIGNENLTDKAMYCYSCTESTEESTKTISTTNVSDNAIEKYAKKGNGYAKITVIRILQ